MVLWRSGAVRRSGKMMQGACHLPEYLQPDGLTRYFGLLAFSGVGV
jgi:hypothetical protein